MLFMSPLRISSPSSFLCHLCYIKQCNISTHSFVSSHYSPSLLLSNSFSSIRNSNEHTSTSPNAHKKIKRHKHFITSTPDEEVKFMEYMGVQLGFKDMSGWYNIDTKHFRTFKGTSLLEKYHHSPSAVVMSVFKDHQWLPWKFHKVPEGFWDDKNNQLAFLKYLESALGYKTMDDWYAVQAKDFIEHGGKTLLQNYMSPRLVLKGVMPEHEWIEWRFHAGIHYWDNMANQRAFMEHVGQQMGFTSMNDWYSVKGKHIIRHGGGGLLRTRYKGSPSAMVMTVFSTHPWDKWRFHTIPLHLITTPSMLRAYFQALAPCVGVKEVDEWRDVSFRQLQALGPCWHVKQCGLMAALRMAYPDHEWGPSDGKSGEKNGEKSINSGAEWTNTIGSSQQFVASLLRKHLPGVEVIENFKATSALFDHSGKSMSIDVFVPSLSLGLEYNGAQHYQDMHGVFLNSASNPKKHDGLKLKQFLDSEYTFIHIPWWWDGKFASLQDIIQRHRPDIQFQSSA